jgi:ubiquinone/menaquinone biosynthesis C-methylase UbiE
VDGPARQTPSTPDLVTTLESAERAVYRYRVAIVSLLELKPGMTAADVGAGSGFIARLMTSQVAPGGQAIATELDPSLVTYMDDRAHAENIQNFSARLGQRAASALDPASVDAISLVETFSVLDQPAEMLQSLSAALKPGGMLVIVDAPREGQGASHTGIDADDVVALVTAAGLTRLDEIGIVPGHYAIRFRKPEK